MTINVGIISQRTVLLASDSQWTDPTSGTVSFCEKIHSINFGSDSVLVALAGLPSVGIRLVEIIRKLAKDVTIKDESSVTTIIEDSVRQLTGQFNDNQWDTAIRAGGSQLMFAYLAERMPQLCLIDVFGHGVVTKPLKNYMVAGCGSALAEYLLDEFSESDMTGDFAINTAIFVIKKVKDHQPAYCGGDTSVKILQRIPRRRDFICTTAQAVDQSVVNKAEKKLIQEDKKTKKNRNARFVNVLKKIAAESWRRLERQRLANQP